MTLEELTAAGLVLKVWSEVLGESVLLVPDTYTPTAGDPITYTHEEVKVLTEGSEDEVRAVHKIKKAFRGRICQADKEAP